MTDEKVLAKAILGLPDDMQAEVKRFISHLSDYGTVVGFVPALAFAEAFFACNESNSDKLPTDNE